MSFKEVKILRKEGEIHKAYKLAKQDLKNDPDDIWNKRSVAWVLYDYLKKCNEENNIDNFITGLSLFTNLNLPDTETMVFNSMSFQIGKIIFYLNKSGNVDYQLINKIFDLIKDYHFTKPSDGYSFLYKSFHKAYKNWSRYLEFADWWGFVNFKEEDYLNEKLNRKSIMSVVEQTYIAYANKLLQGSDIVTELGFVQEKQVDKTKIKEFIIKLDNIIKLYPKYQYPVYYKVKLLMAIGEKEGLLDLYLPFAKQKKNDFWVWELMADIYDVDKEMQLSCLCKALSSRIPDKFLIGTRKRIIPFLIDKEYFDEAKTEVVKIQETTQVNGWKERPDIVKMVNSEWFKTAVEKNDNKLFYKANLCLADELLYKDIPKEIVAVEFVNKNKRILNFIKNKDLEGFFKYSDFIDNPKIGDVLEVRLNKTKNNGFYNVYSLKLMPKETNCSAIKPFKGKLRLINENIGFVNNIFIGQDIIKRYNLVDKKEITGNAIMSYDKKKEEWGWKAIVVCV